MGRPPLCTGSQRAIRQWRAARGCAFTALCLIASSTAVFGQSLYWTQHNPSAVWSNSTTVEPAELVASPAFAYDIAIGSNPPAVYWTGSGAVYRADLDGAGLTTIFEDTEQLNGLAIDDAAGHLYLVRSTSDTIVRVPVSGGTPTTVISGLTSGRALAVDPAGGMLYWADSGGIFRAPLDGSGSNTQITPSLAPFGIALDAADDTVYYTDAAGLHRVDLDGANPVMLWDDFSFVAGGIDVDPGTDTVYWAHAVAGQILRRVGGVVDVAVDAGLAASVRGVTVYTSCSGHGIDTGACSCFPGWNGAQCECRMCAANCNGNGTCDCGTCVCDGGWEGDLCECNDALPCPEPCVNGECICQECVCDAGWIGPACDVVLLGSQLFMAPDGSEFDVPTTGSTTFKMAPNSSRQFSVWLHGGLGDEPALNNYQILMRWFGAPQAGATGTVMYLDDGLLGGGTVQIDIQRPDWVFAGEVNNPPVYNESLGFNGFGFIGSRKQLNDGTDVEGVRYLGEFSLTTSADALGTHEFFFVPEGHAP